MVVPSPLQEVRWVPKQMSQFNPYPFERGSSENFDFFIGFLTVQSLRQAAQSLRSFLPPVLERLLLVLVVFFLPSAVAARGDELDATVKATHFFAMPAGVRVSWKGTVNKTQARRSFSTNGYTQWTCPWLWCWWWRWRLWLFDESSGKHWQAAHRRRNSPT